MSTNAPLYNQVPPVQSVENQSDITLTEDYKLWQALRPYIGHCLNLNHEINNPLAALLGYAELLSAERESLPDESAGYVVQIMKAAERVKEAAELLCEEKIELSEKIDLKPVIEAYKKIAEPLK